MYYVYIIQSSKTGQYYIGSTEDIDKRLNEHNRNIMRSTKHRGPWEIIYREECENRTHALEREHRIKSFKGGGGFKKLLKASSPSSSPA